MNDRSDIERVLGYWLEDGPVAMPDRVVDVVARRISVRPQRRSWRLLRRSSMSPALKYGAAAAAVLVFALVGYNLLPRSPSVGPETSPATSPAPTSTAVAAAPSPVCDEVGAVCAGRLAAGENASNVFQPKLTFTVPEGWMNSLDKDRTYTMHYNFAPGHFFQVVSQLAIPEQNPQCTPAQKSGAGNTVADWVDFLTTHPGLVATAPEPISIGGFGGKRVDVHVSDTWTATCPNSIGPAVELYTNSGAAAERLKWIDDQYTTFRILDVAGETVIIYLESGHSTAELAAVNGALGSVIDSFRFTPTN